MYRTCSILKNPQNSVPEVVEGKAYLCNLGIFTIPTLHKITCSWIYISLKVGRIQDFLPLRLKILLNVISFTSFISPWAVLFQFYSLFIPWKHIKSLPCARPCWRRWSPGRKLPGSDSHPKNQEWEGHSPLQLCTHQKHYKFSNHNSLRKIFK